MLQPYETLSEMNDATHLRCPVTETVAALFHLLTELHDIVGEVGDHIFIINC